MNNQGYIITCCEDDLAAENKALQDRYNSMFMKLVAAGEKMQGLEEELVECKQCCMRKADKMLWMELEIKQLKAI